MEKTVMKKLLSMILLVVLLTAAFSTAACADSGIGIEPGQPMPDFTVSLTDGTTATLSELLKEKDLVVLNIFASWCGPCEKEFPDMEEVFQANSDRMVIVSVSGYPDDTMEVIDEYKASHNLTFPMGLAGDALDFLELPGFPTTLLIDRNGTVGLIKVGAFSDKADFESKVSHFLSPDYDGKPLKTEKAVSITLYLYGWILISGLLMIVGRWGILRKAGKKGWHSLIPLLNVYKEYSLQGVLHGLEWLVRRSRRFVLTDWHDLQHGQTACYLLSCSACCGLSDQHPGKPQAGESLWKGQGFWCAAGPPRVQRDRPPDPRPG